MSATPCSTCTRTSTATSAPHSPDHADSTPPIVARAHLACSATAHLRSRSPAALLMWAAQPPLALGWLGWIAPMPWLVARAARMTLAGRRPYLALWFAAFVYLDGRAPLAAVAAPGRLPGLVRPLRVPRDLFAALRRPLRVAVHQLGIPLLARRARSSGPAWNSPGPT